MAVRGKLDWGILYTPRVTAHMASPCIGTMAIAFFLGLVSLQGCIARTEEEIIMSAPYEAGRGGEVTPSRRETSPSVVECQETTTTAMVQDVDKRHSAAKAPQIGNVVGAVAMGSAGAAFLVAKSVGSIGSSLQTGFAIACLASAALFAAAFIYNAVTVPPDTHEVVPAHPRKVVTDWKPCPPPLATPAPR